MVVVVTAPEATTNAAVRAFTKMLQASFNYRMMEHMLITGDTTGLVDLTSSQAINSDYIKELGTVGDPQIHIEVRAFSEDGELSYNDFIVAESQGITTPEINNVVANSLGNFSQTELRELTPDTLYSSVYCALVFDIITICVVINEGSADLYRAAADELAEVVENLPVD